jgi:predicted nucleic-acid-binding protein
MRAVDTNVIVRLFAKDDERQVAAARALLFSDAVFVPKTVILELEWVLRGAYGAPRSMIASAVETVLTTANVEVEDAVAVARALDWFRQGMDFADALHLASSRHVEAFLTFDAGMRRRAASLGIESPVIAP